MALTVTSAVRQLSDNNPQGTVLGQTTTDLIGFYGTATPVAQPLGNQQTAITRGLVCGSICTFATNQSPSSKVSLTTGEVSMTIAQATAVWQTLTTDLLYINKPSSQAGLGMGNVRSSAANTAGVTFSNLSTGTLTPTATEKYGIVALRGFNALTQTLTPAAVASNTTAEQQFTVTGLRAGEMVQVMKPTSQAGLDIAGCRVVSNNTLGITFMNVTGGTLTPTASESYGIISLGGMDAPNNEMMFQVSVATIASVANATTMQTAAITATNVAATDIMTGVSKPTIQAGLITGNGRTSAGFISVDFANVTAGTLTPTANEIYAVKLYRPNPVAPLVIYTQTLTPVSVAANTTAEQGFTVTGLVANSPVWVNKPSFQAGLGIAGVRVSAVNTLAINYANPTATAITPVAEAYVIGNFQLPIIEAGSSIVQTASLVGQQTSVMANAMRAALASLGMIAGS